MNLLKDFYKSKPLFDQCIGLNTHVKWELIDLIIKVAHDENVTDYNYMKTLEQFKFNYHDNSFMETLDSEHGNHPDFLRAFLTFIVRRDRHSLGTGETLIEPIQTGVISKLIEKMIIAFPLDKTRSNPPEHA
ncbi:MAG: hypothetical protein IJ165_07495 [Proteobacteria bacterium]|nr:hypothetical protein [Pseudomonadota bacterium]